MVNTISYIQGEDRDQNILFPESLEEYIAFDNPVRIINEYVKFYQRAIKRRWVTESDI